MQMHKQTPRTAMTYNVDRNSVKHSIINSLNKEWYVSYAIVYDSTNYIYTEKLLIYNNIIYVNASGYDLGMCWCFCYGYFF